MNADCADDIALLTNTPTQYESLRQRLEQVAAGIDLHVNADKTEYIYFNQRGENLILTGGSLKVLDKFPYLRSSISSTDHM